MDILVLGRGPVRFETADAANLVLTLALVLVEPKPCLVHAKIRGPANLGPEPVKWRLVGLHFFRDPNRQINQGSHDDKYMAPLLWKTSLVPSDAVDGSGVGLMLL